MGIPSTSLLCPRPSNRCGRVGRQVDIDLNALSAENWPRTWNLSANFLSCSLACLESLVCLNFLFFSDVNHQYRYLTVSLRLRIDSLTVRWRWPSAYRHSQDLFWIMIVKTFVFFYLFQVFFRHFFLPRVCGQRRCSASYRYRLAISFSLTAWFLSSVPSSPDAYRLFFLKKEKYETS